MKLSNALPKTASLKPLSSLLFLILFTNNVFSQHSAISLDKNNFVYLGVKNPLTIAVENTSNNDIIVKTNNGTITGKLGEYIFYPAKIGGAEIIIYKKGKQKLKKIARWWYRVKNIPDPIAKVGPGYRGDISKGQLVSYEYIRAELENFDYAAWFKVDSFKLRIKRFDSSISDMDILNIGNELSEEVTDAILSVKQYDSVFFEKIYVMGPDKISRIIAPIFFKIIGNTDKVYKHSKSFRIPDNSFNETIKPESISKSTFKEYFAGIDTLKGNDAVYCTWGIYKKISDKYIVHIPYYVPVYKKNKRYLFTVDSLNTKQTLTLLIYDKEKADLQNICTDLFDSRYFAPTRYIGLSSGKFIVQYTSDSQNGYITVLLKDLIFVDQKTGEKIEINNELIWKTIDWGFPG